MPDDTSSPAPRPRKKKAKPTEAIAPSAPAQPELVTRWLDLLTEEGYRPKAEQREEAPHQWRVNFKQEGVAFGVYLDEQDPDYTQLELAYSLDPAVAPLAALLAAANLVNSETKAVKVTVSPEGNAAWFMMEWFSDTIPTPKILDRLVSQARHGASEFFEKRKELSHPELHS